MTGTEYVIYCPAHRHYLRFVSAGGTTWTSDKDQARRYSSKPAARKDAERATWLDHNPTPWAVAVLTAELDR